MFGYLSACVRNFVNACMQSSLAKAQARKYFIHRGTRRGKILDTIKVNVY